MDILGKEEVYAAPFAVFLNEDDSNYIEPDISVICDLSFIFSGLCSMREQGFSCFSAKKCSIAMVTLHSRDMIT